MRFPVDNYLTEWNNTAGYSFGDTTSYGFHEGDDINDNGGGDSDLGKPLYAIADGIVVGVHSHSTIPTFGKHFFIQINGAWGTRFVHYAHCNEIFITEGQQVKEGQKVATLGKSGTQYAHCHFAIKTKANGMDTIANTKAQLDDAWEDPIKFIKTYSGSVSQPSDLQKELDKCRIDRDTHWNDLEASKKTIDSLNQQVSQLNAQNSTLSTELISSQNEVKILKPLAEKVPGLKQELAQSNNDRTICLNAQESLNKQIAQLKLGKPKTLWEKILYVLS